MRVFILLLMLLVMTPLYAIVSTTDNGMNSTGGSSATPGRTENNIPMEMTPADNNSNVNSREGTGATKSTAGTPSQNTPNY